MLYGMITSSSGTSTRVRTGVVTRVLRIVIAIDLLAVLIQAVLAGQILSHVSGARAMHGIVALVVTILSLVQLVLALIAWRRESVPGRLAVFCGVVLVAVVAQLIAGSTAVMAVHVPLGAVLLGGFMILLREVWRTWPDSGHGWVSSNTQDK
jgi:hypothetical protein